nr:MAG TPA: hypothetical protein [Caudoviricetes sp.]
MRFSLLFLLPRYYRECGYGHSKIMTQVTGIEVHWASVTAVAPFTVGVLPDCGKTATQGK